MGITLVQAENHQDTVNAYLRQIILFINVSKGQDRQQRIQKEIVITEKINFNLNVVLKLNLKQAHCNLMQGLF
jgi:hypothetical protein